MKPKTKLIWGLILCFVACSVSGCTNPVYMSPWYQEQFGQFADSTIGWLEKCQADPSACEQALGSVAEGFQTWSDIFKGFDPNER